MNFPGKFITFNNDDSDITIVFPGILKHSKIARKLNTLFNGSPIGAGFVEINKHNSLQVYGESTTLKISTRIEDKKSVEKSIVFCNSNNGKFITMEIDSNEIAIIFPNSYNHQDILNAIKPVKNIGMGEINIDKNLSLHIHTENKNMFDEECIKSALGYNI